MCYCFSFFFFPLSFLSFFLIFSPPPPFSLSINKVKLELKKTINKFRDFSPALIFLSLIFQCSFFFLFSFCPFFYSVSLSIKNKELVYSVFFFISSLFPFSFFQLRCNIFVFLFAFLFLFLFFPLSMFFLYFYVSYLYGFFVKEKYISFLTFSLYFLFLPFFVLPFLV